MLFLDYPPCALEILNYIGIIFRPKVGLSRIIKSELEDKRACAHGTIRTVLVMSLRQFSSPVINFSALSQPFSLIYKVNFPLFSFKLHEQSSSTFQECLSSRRRLETRNWRQSEVDRLCSVCTVTVRGAVHNIYGKLTWMCHGATLPLSLIHI